MAFLVSTTSVISSPTRGSSFVIRSRGTRYTPARPLKRAVLAMSSAVVEKGSGMRIIPAADEATVAKLGCRSWPKWGCGPSTFPWTYSDEEVCLVLTGDFTVIPDDGGTPMGMMCRLFERCLRHAYWLFTNQICMFRCESG